MSRAVSIHIGVDNPGGPGDPRTLLQECESAAWRMAELAYQAGYDSMLVLRGATATLSAVQAALFNASQLLEKDDLLLVSYSGHGSQKRNLLANERDKTDEAWSLHDGELVDDTLAGWWRQFRPGVRIVMVSESCYSGGMDRGDDDVPAPAHWRRRRRMRSYRDADEAIAPCIVSSQQCAEIRATVLILAASRDYQESEEKLFTDCLLEVWNRGAFAGDYCELFGKVKQKVMDRKPEQRPQILMLGTPDREFPRQPAFRRTGQDVRALKAEQDEPERDRPGRDKPEPQDSDRPPPDQPDDDPGETGTRDGRRRARVYRDFD
jgi:hypothetical protein